CFVRNFFRNKYYHHPMQYVWDVQPELARDWQAIVGQCAPEDEPASSIDLWPNGQTAILRAHLEGATQAAQLPPPDGVVGRYEFADNTALAVSAVPNAFPHTELDFGAVTWAAYGSRLLSDMGYGSIGGSFERYDISSYPDNNPAGHNTLVLREAVHPDFFEIDNTSQINGERGTIDLRTRDGVEYVELDGSAVYGANDPLYGGITPQVEDNRYGNRRPAGWLQGFQRLLIPIPGGHYLIADMFRTRPEMGAVTADEFWHVQSAEMPVTPDQCVDQPPHSWKDSYVDLEVIAPDTMLLQVACHSLVRGAPAESVGRIQGASLHGGRFELGEHINFINRVNQPEDFQRARWVPNEAATDGLRVFLLAAATSVDALPATQVTHRSCGDQECFDVQVDENLYTLTFTDEPRNWVLSGLVGWE
ncbi:MAG: hypothetical protein ABGY29_04540, partial [bacterium]